jgi:hypothetical protein
MKTVTMKAIEQDSIEQRLLGLTLGIITAPVLVGLVVTQAGERWLRDLTFAERSWWLDQHLPPLDEAALTARDQQQQHQDH